MNLFLRAKHWQIFLVTFGIPFLVEAIFLTAIFSSLINDRNADPTIVFGFFRFFPVIMLLFMAGSFGWFWSVAIGLQKMIPATIKMKTTMFKAFFFIPLIYITGVMTAVGFFFNSNTLQATNEPPFWLFGAFAVIIPLHLFSVFCIFYCLYFWLKPSKQSNCKEKSPSAILLASFFWYGSI